SLGETEIFEPICQGMAKAGRSGGHALLGGHALHAGDEDTEVLAQQLCAAKIARRVSGVFFAPMEGFPNKDAFNLSIVDRLSASGIAVVLLDRCIYKWPNRSRFDLVGIDNRRGGNVVARHLLNHGVKRPVFLARPNSAPTVDQRFAGFAEALRAQGLDPGEMIRADPANQAAVRQILDSRRPDAFVCANDRTVTRTSCAFPSLRSASLATKSAKPPSSRCSAASTNPTFPPATFCSIASSSCANPAAPT
ncbi:MAG: substrate-binding domain-containing protein, partial [Bryobacteraceae bacterium]